MSFILGELIVEAVLREQLDIVKKTNTDIFLEDVFGGMYSDLLADKYGTRDWEKIKKILTEGEAIKIFKGFYSTGKIETPSISIQILQNPEAEDLAGIGDVDEIDEIDITPETICDSFDISSFDSDSGKVFVPDDVDLSAVYYNNYLTDSDGNEFKVITPISNETGNKYLYLEYPTITDSTSTLTFSDLVLTNAKILSAIDTKVYKCYQVPCRETLLLGIHDQTPAFCVYLYHIVRYLLLKGRISLMENGLDQISISGAPFERLTSFMPEQLYNRGLTISYMKRDSWREEEITPADNIDVSGIEFEEN